MQSMSYDLNDWKIWENPTPELEDQIKTLESEAGPIEDYHDLLQLGVAHPGEIVREAALSYASQGMHVFPCSSDKKPITKWRKGGPGHVATTDPEQIKRWFGRDSQFPDAVIGVATGPSNLLVLDVDTHKGADPKVLEEQYGEFPLTLRQDTPSGGYQLFFAADDARARTTGSVLAVGIDTRGIGGMTVVPPMPNREWVNRTHAIAPVPESLLAGLAAKAGKAKRVPHDVGPSVPATQPIQHDLDWAQDLANQIDPKDHQEYHSWISVLMALHHLTKGSPEGAKIAAEWSGRDETFPDGHDETLDKWGSFTVGGGLTEGHLIKLVEEAGGSPYRVCLDLLSNDDSEVPANAVKPEKVLSGRFRFQSPSEFREAVQQPTPILDGFIYGHGQYLLFGKWGLGKTFVAIDLALAVAHRFEKWHGRRLYMDRPVAYLAFEGEYALPSRLAAWEKHHDRKIDEDRVRFWCGHASLTEPEDCNGLLGSIAEFQPGLVVVDTLSAASPGADENAGSDMGQILAWGRRVSREAGATVLFVHHPPRSNPKAARGHSTLEANTDGVLRLEASRGGGFSMVGHKVRCDAPAPPLQLNLQSVELGPDPIRPDRQISGAVVVSGDASLTVTQQIEQMLLERVGLGEEVPLRELIPAVAELSGYGQTKARELLEQVVPTEEADVITGLAREQGARKAWIIRREAPQD